MKSKKLLSISAMVISVPFVVSMIMFLCNVKYIKYCSLFGDIVNEMRYNYAILGLKFDNSTAEMYKDFANKGNLSFTALCVVILLLIAFFVVYLVSLKIKSIEILQEQTVILQNSVTKESQEKPAYCNKCGTATSIGSSFCSHCGSPLVSTHIIENSKEKNKFLLPLIILIIVQIIGILFGLSGTSVGGAMMITAIITIPISIVLGALTISTAKKINGKSGLALGIVAVSLYGFVAFIVLLSAIIGNL